MKTRQHASAQTEADTRTLIVTCVVVAMLIGGAPAFVVTRDVQQ